MKKLIFTLTGFIAVIIFGQIEAKACSCLAPSPDTTIKQRVTSERNEAQAVFSGEVVSITPASDNHSFVVKFRADRSWKGARQKELTLTTGQGGGDCGFRFEVGQSYLVYAHRGSEARLSVTICSRTTSLKGAADDLKILGKGRKSV